MDISGLRDERILTSAVADVGVTREANRRRRLLHLLILGALIAAWLWVSVFAGHLVLVPHLSRGERQVLPLVAILILVAAVMILPLMAAGRSPHGK